LTDKLSTQDDEIVKRLKNLRGAGVNYPADSLKKRRTSFQNETKGLVLAAPLAFLAKGRFQFLANVTEKGLETILVSLLVVSASLSAYLFRDEIKGLLIPGTSVPTVIHPTRTPRPTLTFPPTATLTSATTLLPDFWTTPTPTPTSKSKTNPTEPGLHIGQTKTPKP